MRWRLLAILAGLVLWSAAHAAFFIGQTYLPALPSTCPQGTTFADGCASAPSGTPQYANYLSTGTIINAGLAGVGSGYTNGTGYAWTLTCSGTNATGTVDVVSGSLSNVQITNHGSGCTAGENNITTPAGAGAGTGGQIQGYSPGFRPAWNVAGVDFAVGPQSTPTLDPATINITGVSINTTTCLINVTGNNVIISGYDFTKKTCNSGVGGWYIVVSGTNFTLTNFKAQSPPTSLIANGFLLFNSSATGTHTVNYCTIDGNIANQTASSDGWLIDTIQSSGTLIVEYCLLTNAFGDNISNGTGPGTTIKWNVLTNSKYSAAHGEYVNSVNGNSNGIYDFNLTIQDYADSTGWPGRLSSVWENGPADSSNSITGVDQSNNVSFLFGTNGHASSGGDPNFLATGVWSDLHVIPSGTSTNTSPNIKNNYVAVSGITGTVSGAGFLTCDSSVITPTVSGNINMDSGTTISGSAPCN